MKLEFLNPTVDPITVEARTLTKNGKYLAGARLIVQSTTETDHPYVDGFRLRVGYAWKRGVVAISDDSFQKYSVVPKSSTKVVFNSQTGNPPGEIP